VLVGASIGHRGWTGLAARGAGGDMRRKDREQPSDDLTMQARHALRPPAPAIALVSSRGILADIRFTCDRDHG